MITDEQLADIIDEQMRLMTDIDNLSKRFLNHSRRVKELAASYHEMKGHNRTEPDVTDVPNDLAGFFKAMGVTVVRM